MRRPPRCATPCLIPRRCVHHLSRVFLPTGTITTKSKGSSGRGHDLLLKAGFIRPSSAGIFTLLPLGQRVLDKIEARVASSMATLGASKISLPVLSAKALWTKTGRWHTAGAELFRLTDRKTAEFCLSPTHEESVTRLVADDVNGYRQLPVRLYQIGRKFRDEMRPRGGMLRGKEFIMKDLYTFDHGVPAAIATYRQVQAAYAAFFDTLDMPYRVAEADSGNIGGDMSHEYHLPSEAGEDTLLECPSCAYVANQELARTDETAILAKQQQQGGGSSSSSGGSGTETRVYGHQVFRDTVLFVVHVPAGRDVNMLKLLRLAQKVDASVTGLVPQAYTLDMEHGGSGNDKKIVHHLKGQQVMAVVHGDPCPQCRDGSGTLQEVRAIEIGHTFHLGVKYAQQLGFKYTTPDNTTAFPEMGCHGLGITRLLAAMAEIRHDTHGLTWPQGFAPYHSTLIMERGLEDAATLLAQHKGIDAVDDRAGLSVAYRAKDAHQMGIPHVYVMGKRFWKNNAALLGANKSDLKDLDRDILPDLLVESAARGDDMKDWKLIKLKDCLAQ